MPLSSRYRTLVQRCAKLRQHFLPDRFSPVGSYSQRQIDRTRGYRLLVHAEIEAYLEDQVRTTATRALHVWKHQTKISLPLVGILAFAKKFDEAAPNPNTVRLLNFRLSKSNGHLSETIKENHELREKNLYALLLPIGIDETTLDPVWVGRMESFGVARGDVAHQSAVPGSVHHQVDPKSEYETVRELLKGLALLDIAIGNLIQ